MNKTQQYEAYKQYLRSLNLSSAEYEKRLREWCKKTFVLVIDVIAPMCYN